ncbi:hypothetical protein ACYSNU_18720 [Enterococcus sp. LJL120]
MKLLSFNLKKICSDKTIFIFFILLIVISITPTIINYNSENFESSKDESLRMYYQSQEDAIESMKGDTQAQTIVSEMEKSNEALDKYFESEAKNDWYGQLKAELEFEELNLESIQKGTLSGDVVEQKKIVSELQYLVDNRLERVYQFDTKAPAFNQLEAMLSDYQLYFIICGVVIIFITTYDKRNRTSSFFNSIPKSLFSLFLSENIILAFISILAVIFPLIGKFLITVVYGVGSLKYPVITSGESTNITINNLGNHLLYVIFLIIMSILFLCSVSFFVSILTSNLFINSIIVFALIFVKDYIPQESNPLYYLWNFLPFSYFNASDKLLVREVVYTYNDVWRTGIIILFLWSMLFTLFSFLIIKKKQRI